MRSPWLGQIDAFHMNLDAVRGTQLRRQAFHRVDAARREHQIDALRGEQVLEFHAEATRCAGYERADISVDCVHDNTPLK